MPYSYDKKATNRVLDSVKADPLAKTKKPVEYPELLFESHLALGRFFEYVLTRTTAYNLANWVWSWNNYVTLKGQHGFAPYQPRDIIDVDLGGTSYGDEFILRHPCVVICECKNKVFVVPCSSSPKQGRDKSGNLYPESVIIQGGAGLEFSKPTVALPYQSRFIDKTRILNKTGILNQAKFDEIRNILFTHMFADKQSLINDAENLKRDLESKSKEAEDLQRDLENANSTKSDLEQQLQKMTMKYEDIDRQIRDQKAK